MKTCKECGKEIKWTLTKSGAWMPLDAIPKKMVLVQRGIGEILTVYMPHWATCSNPNKFRTKEFKKEK